METNPFIETHPFADIAGNRAYIMAGKSNSGQSCAFVEYSSAAEADVAIQTLHDKYEIRPGAGMILVKRARSSEGAILGS